MLTLTLTNLRENVASGNHKVDREAGVIRDVRILGRESQNGRTYSQHALEQACRLYQHIKVNIDHPDRATPGAERKFEEGFGELRNCKVTTSGVYGDLHFPKSHPKTALVIEYAERFPRQFGLSHNAEGEVVQRNGDWVVESIEAVYSVDIVGCPATNAGLFESVGRVGRRYPKTISLREAEQLLRRSGRVVPSWLKLLFEAAHTGVIGANQQIDIPDELEDQIEGAEILSMEDEADQLELSFAPEKLQQVKQIAIKQIAKKSTNGRQTALDVQLLNDFIDSGIAMLEKMFPETLGRGPERDDSLALPESTADFVRRLRGLRRQQGSERVQEFSSNLRKPPIITPEERRRESIRKSKLQSQDTNWKLPADTNEFVSRLRRG